MTRRAAIAGLVALMLATGAAHAQSGDLPPAAREAFDRGVVAAEGQQWLMAVRAFTEAQKLAPVAPAVLFNLGLALGHAGQELRGIAYLRAYLAAVPQAPNAAAVGKEILRLEIATEEKIARIMRQAVGAAGAGGSARWDRRVQYQQAAAGDVEGAIKGGLAAEDAWDAHAMALAHAGDVAGAEAVLAHITDARKKSSVYSALAASVLDASCSPTLKRASVHWQAVAKEDGDAARALAAKIADPEIRARALARVLCRDPRPGEISRAEPVLAQLLADAKAGKAESVLGGTTFLDLLYAMLLRAVKDGDIASAVRLGEWALRTGSWTADDVLSVVVPAQFTAGDVAGAKATIQKIVAAADPLVTPFAQASSGDYGGARAAIGRTKCNFDRHDNVWARELARHDGRVAWLIFAQVAAGDLPAARATARAAAAECVAQGATLPYWTDEGSYVRLIAVARMKLGDAAGARDTLKGTGYFFEQEQMWPALDVVLRRATAPSDIATLENDVPPMIRYPIHRPYALLDIADAYARVGADARAQRALAEAARLVVAGEDLGTTGPWTRGTLADIPDADLARMVRAAEIVGDEPTARTLRALFARRTKPGVARWLEQAKDMARYDAIVDVPKALMAAGAYPKSIGEVAELLADRLFRLRALATRP